MDDISELRAKERSRIERHMPDCFGPAGTCQSCGCDRQGRLYGRGSRPCVSHAYIVAWAKHPVAAGCEGRLGHSGCCCHPPVVETTTTDC